MLDLDLGGQTVRDDVFEFFSLHLELDELTSVPEPSSALLLLTGGLVIGLARRRFRSAY